MSKIEAAGNKGCSDNCTSLCNDALDYIPRIKDVPNIEQKAKKEECRFCHYMTACLLCPQQLRDEFNADMEGFCRRVQNGMLPITHDDWPSFLYPEDKYNADALDEHLLRGTFLLSVCLYQWFIYMLTLFLVFPTSLHWTANWYKGYTSKGAQEKLPHRSV
jgi:hypothetical protein